MLAFRLTIDGHPEPMLFAQARGDEVDGRFTRGRFGGSIEVVDGDGAAVATYTFEHGWISRYVIAAGSAGQDEGAVEEITIAVESYKRT